MGKLNEKLANIQAELKVKKSRYNKFGKYNYRSAEDILEALKPLQLKYKVTFTISEKSIGDMLIESTAIVTDWESDNAIHVSAIVGVEKAGGMALPQAFGSASSYGKKYAIGNLLLIDDTADADATNQHKTITNEPNRFAKPIATTPKPAVTGGNSPATDLGF